MFPELDKILIDQSAISTRVQALGGQIAADLQADIERTGIDRIVLVPILTGAIVFVADLIRHMPLKLSLGVVAVSSYPGRSLLSKGAAIRSELPPDLRGKHVLLVDDVLDSGQTLSLIRDLVLEQKPASFRICVLLRKHIEAGRPTPVDVDYVGFEIPDEFVVGYGLDFDGFYRNFPHVGTVKLG
jgi:hypoxanthine phosphoribosyltransferase